MKTFWLSFWLIFWAEMGDKTQLVALAYATRYRLRHVIIGMLWPILIMFLLSVWIGALVGSAIPLPYIQATAAVCFFAFAVWTLRGQDEEEESAPKISGKHPIVLIGTSFFLAEFGDKTMLAAIALAANHPWFLVWAGSVLAMAAADGLGALAGNRLGKHIPEKTLKWIGAIVFFLFGLSSSFDAYRSFKMRT